MPLRETLNVHLAFKFVEDDKIPEFWKPVRIHMVFDIKADLTRTARQVGNGNETEEPSSLLVQRSTRVCAHSVEWYGCSIRGRPNAYNINADSKENL
jgi:hypothetical protein